MVILIIFIYKIIHLPINYKFKKCIIYSKYILDFQLRQATILLLVSYGRVDCWLHIPKFCVFHVCVERFTVSVHAADPISLELSILRVFQGLVLGLTGVVDKRQDYTLTFAALFQTN